MAQDYNIWIHGNMVSNPGVKNTTPFESRQGAEDGESESLAPFVANAIKTGENIATQGFKSVASKGVAALTKAIPWVAVAVVAGTIIDKVVGTGFNHLEDYTGDYRYSMTYDNAKTWIGNVLNPVGAALKVAHFDKQAEKERRRIAEENKLIGNSIIGKVKIGV